MKKGFSLMEVVVVVGIFALIAGISMVSFSSMKNSQALDRNTDLVVEVLRQARSQTLTSLGDTNYGVHFTSNQFTLFSGGSYSEGAGSNKIFSLSGSDNTITASLEGGGSNVIFNRLSGETAQNGTILVTSASAGRTRTVVVHNTGLIEFQ